MNGPIGIFDSGIGGLTVASALQKRLPNESLLYFGDTAHMPYGDKSAEAIARYSLRIAQFLVDQGSKMLVIACNSASAHAFNLVQEKFGNQIPIVNVIDPVVSHLLTLAYSKIGVIGTKATIQSGVFANKIGAKNNSIKVKSVATPLLAPMIEEGFFNNNISRTIICNYLNHYKLKGIKAIILACTHYPLIIKEIDEFYNGKVAILNTADIVSQHVSDLIVKNALASNQQEKPKHVFYVSDLTPSFQTTAKLFFGEIVSLNLVPL